MTEYDIKKKLLFVPCLTKQDLHRWIQVFLGLNLPDCTVYLGSNSNPMQNIWEIYHAAYKNDNPKFSRVMAYAARDSFKSLSASILQVLCLVHLERSGGIMAAVESQALRSVGYLKDFLRRPILREFVVGDNKRTIEFVRYNNSITGDNLTSKEYGQLPENEKYKYREIKTTTDVVICTMSGTNSLHVPFFCADEVDLANPVAFAESGMIPAPRDGKMPITLYTSSRKFGYGLVQQLLDNAHETNLIVRHWNLIDVTSSCPPDRHRPDLPKIPIYRDEKLLKAISEEDFNNLSIDKQKDYIKDEGYVGCLQNCSLFGAGCQGRLATEQKSNSPLLKPIQHVINQFKSTSLEVARAQLLCLKPSQEGMVYPYLDRDVHMISAAEIAEKITGEVGPENFSKHDLINLAKTKEVRFYSGMDFGFSHNFAVVTAIIDGPNAFVVDAFAIPELELSQKLEVCETRIKHLNPIIYPDTAYPADIKTFKKHGYQIRDWDKFKGSVLAGIEIVRLKLKPTIGKPELFFLEDDEGCEQLFKRLNTYHWKLDSAGRATDVPDDIDDDDVDALRYLIMNVFAIRGKIAVGKADPVQVAKTLTKQNWLQQAIQDSTGDKGPSEDSSGGKTEKKGSFLWSI